MLHSFQNILCDLTLLLYVEEMKTFGHVQGVKCGVLNTLIFLLNGRREFSKIKFEPFPHAKRILIKLPTMK
jgi:hypothetical protein